MSDDPDLHNKPKSGWPISADNKVAENFIGEKDSKIGFWGSA